MIETAALVVVLLVFAPVIVAACMFAIGWAAALAASPVLLIAFVFSQRRPTAERKTFYSLRELDRGVQREHH